jgi:hypothetical protein
MHDHEESALNTGHEASDDGNERAKRVGQLRRLQAALWPVFERELKEQREHDAEAQRLMDTDPEGHIEFMKMPQAHKALARELPEELLREEARILTENEVSAQIIKPRVGTMMGKHLLMERWSIAMLLPLGAWLLFSPTASSYQSVPLVLSDIISGLLVMALGALALSGRVWAVWAASGVAAWIVFAPLAFWAPTAFVYTNDTLVGLLVIGFAILAPMRMEMPGLSVPPGWSYNPSAWMQRIPIIVLGLLSFFMSRHMAAYQLGYISWVFDPIFGDGTVRVLTSDVSRAFPISDAGLGAYVYLIEMASAAMGDARRWRTMPWMVAMFGVAVVPLGIISVILVILQPVAVGAWATLALASAGLMLAMVALSLDEIVAMLQFLGRVRRSGQSVWRAFWLGGSLPETLEAKISPVRVENNRWGIMMRGVSLPWNLVASILLGAWLMAAPSVFGSASPAAHNDHLLGALVLVVAVIATAEVTRALRFLNVLLGLSIMVVPWILSGAPLSARLNDVVMGLLIVALSIPRGAVKDRYASWQAFIF